MPEKILYVTGPENRKVGILAATFRDLWTKCDIKFYNQKATQLTFFLEDDTEIDEDFFEVLDNKTDLKVSSASPVSPLAPLMIQLEHFLEQYLQLNCQTGDKLEELLASKDPAYILKLIGQLPPNASECLTSSMGDHPAWFEGLDTKFKTKEAVLRNSAEARVRGYLQKAKKDLSNTNSKKYDHVIQYFQAKLKQKKYNCGYFDRGADAAVRLCSDEGTFPCYGKYDVDSCRFEHRINPYATREQRIIFSTWNLDHMIEKSRTVIPLLQNLLDQHRTKDINLNYFFDLLFEHQRKDGDGNLKLVHIVCHDKTPHTLACNQSKLLNSTLH